MKTLITVLMLVVAVASSGVRNNIHCIDHYTYKLSNLSNAEQELLVSASSLGIENGIGNTLAAIVWGDIEDGVDLSNIDPYSYMKRFRELSVYWHDLGAKHIKSYVIASYGNGTGNERVKYLGDINRRVIALNRYQPLVNSK